MHCTLHILQELLRNITLILQSSVNSVDRNKYQIHIPLPPKIDPTVTMMQVSACFFCNMMKCEHVK